MYRGEPPHDWFPNRWMSIGHPSAFEPARPKSTGTGNLPNNNPKKIGYVFGKGGELTVIVLKSDEYLKHKSYTYMCLLRTKVKGWGYYNLKTHEANDVLIKRLERNLEESLYVNIIMLLFPPCWLCLPCALAVRKDIKTALQVARLRKYAPDPTTELELPLELKKEISKKSRGQIKNSTSGGGACGGGYYTAACGSGNNYSDAAACGAAGGGGACGGGGAAGGGACGGGGEFLGLLSLFLHQQSHLKVLLLALHRWMWWRR